MVQLPQTKAKPEQRTYTLKTKQNKNKQNRRLGKETMHNSRQVYDDTESWLGCLEDSRNPDQSGTCWIIPGSPSHS